MEELSIVNCLTKLNYKAFVTSGTCVKKKKSPNAQMVAKTIHNPNEASHINLIRKQKKK